MVTEARAKAVAEDEVTAARKLLALVEPASFGDLDQMISDYGRDHDILAIQLHALDDNGWNHQAWLIEGAEEILLKDTVGGLLWIALFDIVHHRGQLSTYIRPMGGKVPSIYGPSADHAGERN